MIVDIATGEIEDREPTPEEQGKNPAAVSLGRRGNLKGGKARAKSLSAKLGETVAFAPHLEAALPKHRRTRWIMTSRTS
jgi:hypothetical protein